MYNLQEDNSRKNRTLSVFLVSDCDFACRNYPTMEMEVKSGVCIRCFLRLRNAEGKKG